MLMQQIGLSQITEVFTYSSSHFLQVDWGLSDLIRVHIIDCDHNSQPRSLITVNVAHNPGLKGECY